MMEGMRDVIFMSKVFEEGREEISECRRAGC